MQGRPMAEHICPFTPEIISDKGYPKFLESDVFEHIKGDLRYVEIIGGVDQGGRMGDVPDRKQIIVYNLIPNPDEGPRPYLKATELLFVRKGITEMEGWRPENIARGFPPKILEKKTADGYPQTMERLDSNEPLPLPGAIAKWKGGSGVTAYIVCKSKIQPDLDICRRIAECLELPYSPPAVKFISEYNNFLSKPLPVTTDENIYA